MGIIHKLAPHEAQKIAAGEVVERPYNIVKELVENALDAGATNITLYIEDGGKKLIRCIDNGCGMTEEDALMSIEHHATSKLITIDDLESIKTFGFRGEALSSISAISNMKLATQQHNVQHGTQIIIDYGALTKKEIIAQSPGTDIAIADIFTNIPVRKKFLKARETEWRAIYTLVQALALAHQHVTFMLYHDNQQMIVARATDSLVERVTQIFDQQFAHTFLTCENKKNDIAISGGITHYQYQRYDRNQQFFFVNKRWVKNYKLGQAFNKGFQNIMPPGKHPAGVIFITVPQADVDINVHPRKEEVVFLHPRIVEITLEDMVRKRLEDETAKRVNNIEKYQFSTSNFIEQRVLTPAISFPPILPGPDEFYAKHRSVNEVAISRNVPIIPLIAQKQIVSEVLPEASAKIFTQKNTAPHYTIIGQLLKTYLLLETQDGLLVVDQHAAHESVLYEQFSRKSNDVARCQLLFPEVISMGANDQKVLLRFNLELNSLGITFESVGENAIAITETPLHIKNYNFKDLVYDVIAWAQENSTFDTQVWHTKISKKLYAMMACKAAVKAGDELSQEHIAELLQSLYKTEHRLTCPHGRPTTWLISQYELERTFKRKL